MWNVKLKSLIARGGNKRGRQIHLLRNIYSIKIIVKFSGYNQQKSDLKRKIDCFGEISFNLIKPIWRLYLKEEKKTLFF